MGMKRNGILFVLVMAAAILISTGARKSVYRLLHSTWYIEHNYADSASLFSDDTLRFRREKKWQIHTLPYVADSITETNVVLDCGLFVRTGFALKITPVNMQTGEKERWRGGKSYYGTIRVNRRRDEITFQFRDCANTDRFWEGPVTTTMTYEIIKCSGTNLVLVRKKTAANQ